MPLAVFPSFARGELAPSLHGRVDTAVFHSGLATARNVYVRSSGGVDNRPGLQFIGPVKTHADFTRLIRFQFKSTDTYVLELGSQYMRVIRQDAHVTETALTGCTATAADPVVVTKTSHGYSDGDDVECSGFSEMTELNGRRFRVANKTNNTFELTSVYTGADEDGSSYTAETTGGSCAKVYEIATPYATSDLEELKFVQSADVMTLVHPDYDPRELTRTDHNAWTLTTITFSPDQDDPTGITATQDGTTGSTTYEWKVTAIAEDTLEESLAGLDNSTLTSCTATAADPVVVTKTSHGLENGDEIEASSFSEMTELNGRRFTVANKTANTFELKGEDGSGYSAETTGGTCAPTFVRITDGNATLSATNHVDLAWSEASGAQRYAVYRKEDGIYGLIGETEDLSFVDDGKTPDADSSPPRFREPFLGTDNAPGAASYYEQRQVFGGPNNKPDTTEYSQTGNFKNLTASTPSNADDAITATLNSLEVNVIRHYVPLEDLLVLTTGEEWRVDSAEDAGFSAETLRQKPQSRWGAGHQRPATIGNTVLFVTEDNASVRSLGYSLDIDGYGGGDISVLAEHLFRDYRIRDAGLAYARGQTPLVAAVKHDGEVAVLSFQQEQEMVAWAHWDTEGDFESATAIRPNSTEPDEAFYFVVERINTAGDTYRLIERTHSRRFETVKDAFFVDSGVSVDSPVTITGVTAANPAVVTAASHGFSNDDEIDIDGIKWVADTDSLDNKTQPDQLNGRRYLVKNKTSNTFELEDEDGNAVDGSAFNAYLSGGEARATVSEVTGLEHLNGETVVALADGDVVTGLTVSANKVTLSSNASRVHVGKKFISDVETLNIEPQSAGDTLQGQYIHVVRVVIRLDRSRGLWAGPDKTDLTELVQRQDEAWGDPTDLKTGDVEIVLPPQWKSNGRIFLRQRDPLPMSVLMVVPKAEAED